MNRDSGPTDGNFSEFGATRMQRVNQVCNRFEAAWRSGERPSLTEHLAAAPVQERPVLARMLVELDIDYRRMHGETPLAEDYRNQLPFEATWLEALVRGAFDATVVESPGAQETSGEFSLPQRRTASAEVLPRVWGDYLLLERIGGGGMGVVYKAEHRHMRRIVALKLIRPEQANAQQAQQRFQREVEAAARLHHPYIVTAFDARVEQGAWGLVTEFVAGQDLSRVVQESGPLSLSQTLHCVCQTAAALEYAHQQGVVHRDIKPSNLLLDSAGNVKVLDMGLARLSSLEQDTEATVAAARLTQTGYVVGTVDFMSPEQAKNSAQADARSDIYSLGCTLYYLLTGEAAYRGTTVMETLLAHREQPIPSLSSIRQEVPPELEEVFRRMLAKQPQARYQAMSEVLAALKCVQAEFDASATSPPSVVSGKKHLAEVLANGTQSASRRKYGALWLWILGGGVLLLLLGLVLATAWRPQDELTAPPSRNAPTNDTVLTTSEIAALPTFDSEGAQAAQTAAAQQLGVPVETTGELAMRLLLIPAYRLQVGEQTLVLPRPIYMSATEVTVGEFRQFATATQHVTEAQRSTGWGVRDNQWILTEGYSWNNLGDQQLSDDLPAVNISWNDAQAFCTWLNTKAPASGRYRLPTEAEWELACRAGSTATWFFGDDRNRLGEYAWYESNSGLRLQLVGQKSPNPFGIHDLLGNESEWCSDLFAPGGTDRVQRGGSFSHRAEEVTSSARWSDAPTSSSHGAFRVVREVAVPLGG